MANPEVMSMTVAFTSKSPFMILPMARNTKIAVMTQIMTTEINAPNTSALYHPKENFPVDSRPAIHRARSEIMKLAKSVSR